MECPRCQKMQRDNAQFCDRCGAPLVGPQASQVPPQPHRQYIRCARCSTQAEMGTRVCLKCGNDLTYRHNPQAQTVPRKRKSILNPFFIGLAVVMTCGLFGYLIDAMRPADRQDAAAIYTPTKVPTAIPRKEYNPIDIRAMAKDPESYRGVGVRFNGEVFSIDQGDGGTVMQIWVQHPDGSEYDREAVVIMYAGKSPGLYEKANVYVWGMGDGSYEGTNGFGGAVEQPVVIADEISY